MSSSLIHVDTFFVIHNTFIQGADLIVIVWQFDLQLPMESVPITTNVVSSNLIHGKVYSIQHYMIKFVSDLRQVSGFLRVFRFPPSKKIDSRSHDITKILLKLALNTINQPTFYTENFIILESFIFQEIHVFFYTCNKMLMYI